MSSHREESVRGVGDEEHVHDEVEDTVGIPTDEDVLAAADLEQASGGATGHPGGANFCLADGSVR